MLYFFKLGFPVGEFLYFLRQPILPISLGLGSSYNEAYLTCLWDGSEADPPKKHRVSSQTDTVQADGHCPGSPLDLK